MNKALILKAFGGSEEEFYKLYPTEAHFRMAMGGNSPFQQFFQDGGEKDLIAKEKRLEKAKKAAMKVNVVDKDMQLIGEDAGRTYYDREYKGKDKQGKDLITPPTKDKAGYEKHIIGLLSQGYNPKSLVKAGLISEESLPKFEQYYKAAYTEKPPVTKQEPQPLDLGIGWAGERQEVFGHSMPTYKDPTGKEYRLQQFKVPAQWDPKTSTWNTAGAWNQPTVLSGYQKDGKFIVFDPSASKIAYEGEGAKAKGYYTQEGLKYPSYVQTGEDQKVMKSGPLTISGATALDVQNTGMNYNATKDVVAPINTRGTGRGIGQDQLISTVDAKNLPATGSMIQQLQKPQQFGGVPDFFNFPQMLFAQGGNLSHEGAHMQNGGSKKRIDQKKFIDDYYNELMQNWIASRSNLSGKRMGPDVQTPGMKLINNFRFNPRVDKLSDEDYMRISNQVMEGVQNIRKLGEPYRYEDYTNIPEQNYKLGGGLSREEDYGSEKKPYPSVKSSDFAGGGRSYPIPTRADAVDALRLAGLHGRADVKAKVYAKYPDLKKKKEGGMPCYDCGGTHMQVGGTMSADLEGTYPTFGYGGPGYQMGGDPSIPYLNQAKVGMETYPGQTQQSKQQQITSQFLNYIQNQTMNALMRDEKKNVDQMFMQMGGNNPYGYNPNMNNQQAFYNAGMAGKENFQQSMGDFFAATKNLSDTSSQYTKTSIKPMAAEGIQVMTNPATGKPYSAEEYAYLKSHFEKPGEKESAAEDKGEQQEGKVQPWYQRRGYSYFPMNYDPVMQMSDKDVAIMEQLAKNPSTNLKEFHAKKRLFGPGVRRIDMVFGAKEMLPQIKTKGQVDLGPNYSNEDLMNTVQDLQDRNQVTDKFSRHSSAKPTPSVENNKMFLKGFDESSQDPMQVIRRAYGGGMPKYQGDVYGSQTGYGAWGFQGAQQPQFTTPESVGIQQPAINKFQMQDSGAPITSANPLPQGQEKQYQVTSKFKNKWDPEAAVNWGLAAGNMVASIFEQGDAYRNMQKWKSMQGADAQFYAQPAGDRGGYDQFGNYQPQNKVAKQFTGQNFGEIGSPYTATVKFGGMPGYQEGGEYYMSDDQIQSILESGGDIEFLD